MKEPGRHPQHPKEQGKNDREKSNGTADRKAQTAHLKPKPKGPGEGSGRGQAGSGRCKATATYARTPDGGRRYRTKPHHGIRGPRREEANTLAELGERAGEGDQPQQGKPKPQRDHTPSDERLQRHSGREDR